VPPSKQLLPARVATGLRVGAPWHEALAADETVHRLMLDVAAQTVALVPRLAPALATAHLLAHMYWLVEPQRPSAGETAPPGDLLDVELFLLVPITVTN
jgi:hypothetical protein